MDIATQIVRHNVAEHCTAGLIVLYREEVTSITVQTVLILQYTDRFLKKLQSMYQYDSYCNVILYETLAFKNEKKKENGVKLQNR